MTSPYLFYTGSKIRGKLMNDQPQPLLSKPPSSWRTISEFTLPGEPGNDRLAVEKVAEIVASLPLSNDRLDRLKTAVAEATLNALEHGNQYDRDLPVAIRVRASSDAVAIGITNFGELDIPEAQPDSSWEESGQLPHADVEIPDIEAKIKGLQVPRGWGFFLIQHMVDEYQVTNQPTAHTIELFLYLEGE
jgi:serine/threonine-protein kinase RsbW